MKGSDARRYEWTQAQSGAAKIYWSQKPMKTLLALMAGTAALVGAPITGVDSFAFSFAPLNTICSAGACVGSSGLPSSGLAFSYDARGSADFGVLGGYAQAAISGSGTATGGVLASTNPYFIEGLTFSGLPAGTPGTVTFSFSVTGTRNFSVGAGGTVGVRVGLATDPIKGPPLSVPDVNGRVTSRPIPFVFGQLLEIRTTLFVDANIFTPVPGAVSTWDYGQTVILNGISVADSSNAAVADFQVVASSGTPYNAGGVVPEPGTWALALAGLAVSVFTLRRTS